MSSESFLPPGARNQTDVFAVHGADPEVLAYAMAKYSRSALSMRESLTEISAQRAEQFLNTFYFQYGHRSIADLAHIAFAVERLSLLAAIVLVDEQRWDGQERSTRYQNFLKSGWYFPDFGPDSDSAQLYSETIESLFAAYQRTTAAVLEALRRRVPCPETLKPEAYERTLKARAFDVARYLLPLATNTSLGQIVNARTLETQVSRLLSHPIAEIRDLGLKLREAATGPAWNVNAQAASRLWKSSPRPIRTFAARRLAAEAACSPARSAPRPRWSNTPSPTTTRSRPAPSSRRPPPNSSRTCPWGAKTPRPRWSIWSSAPNPLKSSWPRRCSTRPATTPTGRFATWSRLPRARVAEIIELGLRHRGKHDEALRAFHAGAALRFDILMDIGGFRDMHRHRRCTQIIQPIHRPARLRNPDLRRPGPGGQHPRRSRRPRRLPIRHRAGHAASAPDRASQLRRPPSPPSTCCRWPRASAALFKMDFAEAQYISNCAPAPPATSATAASPGRCTWPSSASTRPGLAHPRHRLHQAHRPAAAYWKTWSRRPP
jgi:thymidylate synthase ThyX